MTISEIFWMFVNGNTWAIPPFRYVLCLLTLQIARLLTVLNLYQYQNKIYLYQENILKYCKLMSIMSILQQKQPKHLQYWFSYLLTFNHHIYKNKISTMPFTYLLISMTNCHHHCSRIFGTQLSETYL